MKYYIDAYSNDPKGENVELTAIDESGKKLHIFRTDFRTRSVIKEADYVDARDREQLKVFKRSVIWN